MAIHNNQNVASKRPKTYWNSVLLCCSTPPALTSDHGRCPLSGSVLCCTGGPASSVGGGGWWCWRRRRWWCWQGLPPLAESPCPRATSVACYDAVSLNCPVLPPPYRDACMYVYILSLQLNEFTGYAVLVLVMQDGEPDAFSQRHKTFRFTSKLLSAVNLR